MEIQKYEKESIGAIGQEIPKLGFGLMRLPKKGLSIDIRQTEQMVDAFLEAGFTYFDTAYVYPGSEAAAKKALVDRHPRESYTLATKLNVMIAPTAKMAKKQFETSLERTGAGYFDYYLLHALMENNYARYDKLHLWDFLFIRDHSFWRNCCRSIRKWILCNCRLTMRIGKINPLPREQIMRSHANTGSPL